eukprot:4564870-Pyramimonas_sp.AAC.1
MAKDTKMHKTAKAKEKPKSGQTALAGLRRRAQMATMEGGEEPGWRRWTRRGRPCTWTRPRKRAPGSTRSWKPRP